MLKAVVVLTALSGLFGCSSTIKPVESVKLETDTYHACADLGTYSSSMRNSHFARAWKQQLQFNQGVGSISVQALMNEYKTSTENVEFINLSSLYHDYLLFTIYSLIRTLMVTLLLSAIGNIAMFFMVTQLALWPMLKLKKKSFAG